MSGSTTSTATTYTVQTDTAFATGLGVNVPTVAGTVTGTQLTELGLSTVRTTVTTAAQESTLASLASGGIKFDLVLSPGQTVAQFMGYADAINAATLTTAGMQGTLSHAVVAVEGPDLSTAAAVAAYSYIIAGNTNDTFGAATGTATGLSGGDFATVELFQAATDRASSNPSQAGTSAAGTTAAAYSAGNSATAIAGVVVLPYSTTGDASASSVGSYTSGYNVNLTSAPVGEPDRAALIAADQTAHQISAGYNLTGTPATDITQAGATTAGGLLDLLLDARTPVVSTSGTGTATVTTTYAAAGTTYLESLVASAAGTSTSGTGTATGTTTSTTATALSLFDTTGATLTAAGTALNNLEKILTAPTSVAGTSSTGTSSTGTTSTGTTTSGTTTAATLSLTVGTYVASTNVATNIAVFAATGGGDNVVWWDNVDSANGTTGHGAATLGFGEVESSVAVFDPTKGTAAIGTYTNISSLAVTDFGDGPLVVQISNVLGTGTSAVGTYAGVSATATSTVTGGSGGGTTTVTGGSGGGTTTTTGGSGGGTTTTTGGSGGGTITMPPVTTSMGASGGTTLTSTASQSNTITATATGSDDINSLGSDTVLAGGGLDVVFASGPAATVTGSTGTLIFVAGTGNYVAGGGTGNDILYGNSGTSVLTGGATGNSILVAGTGNTTLMGGTGPGAVLFGGTASNTFIGSTTGTDTLVGGSGTNTFTMTAGDVAFGGANGGDTFNTGAAALIVEGPGAERVNLGGSSATIFGGTGTDIYSFTKSMVGTASIIGFKAGDSLNLTGGFTATDSASALSTANTGSFGTVLHLSDGTTINVFGATVGASQITVT